MKLYLEMETDSC